MEMVNTTPFIAERVVLQDRNARDLLVVIVKCTYSLKDNSRLIPGEDQVPIQMADEYYGQPGESSVRSETDLVPKKIGTDLILKGHAYAPGRRGAQVDVSFGVGRTKQVVRVFGNRKWKKGVGSPELFDRIPLKYEYAYGGVDASHPDQRFHEREARNPVGRGFIAKQSGREVGDVLLPNIEDPRSLIKTSEDRPQPAGFGWIGRYWKPRVDYAGTADAKWIETRAPLLPEDFNDRYFNGAPPGLIINGFLRGNEPVEVVNASPTGALRFSLPGDFPRVRVVTMTEKTSLDMKFDTLIVEPDEGRVVMVWRGSRDVHNKLYEGMRIEVDL
jgi:hypothetical protein